MKLFAVYLNSALLCFFLSATADAAGPIRRAAEYLAVNQAEEGNWPGNTESGFTGESTIGLCHAYLLVGNKGYKDACEKAGEFILSSAGYNGKDGTYTSPTYASEAWALALLSKVSSDPENNHWRTALVDLFDAIRSKAEATENFIDALVLEYVPDRLGSAVYDLARFTAASGYVGDEDLDIWRSRLLDTLGQVDNYVDMPVTALAASVWALASTKGGLDDTQLSGSFEGQKLSDLPAILADLQGEAGSFAWHFEDPYDYGHLEPTMLGALALQAAGGYEQQVASAVALLASGVNGDGAAYFIIGDDTSDTAFFQSGETLEGLSAAVLFKRGDTNADGGIDIGDPVFCLEYLFAEGPEPACLDAADSNDDGSVDLSDAVYTLLYLFQEGDPMPYPFEQCGVDGTKDKLTCLDFPLCEL